MYLKDYGIEFVPEFVRVEKNLHNTWFPDCSYQACIMPSFTWFSLLLLSCPYSELKLWYQVDACTGWDDPRTSSMPSRIWSRTLWTYTMNNKPSVLWKQKGDKYNLWGWFFVVDGDKWTFTQSLASSSHSRLRFTLLTLVELIEYLPCFTHKGNTQVCNCTNYLNEYFINKI